MMYSYVPKSFGSRGQDLEVNLTFRFSCCDRKYQGFQFSKYMCLANQESCKAYLFGERITTCDIGESQCTTPAKLLNLNR